MTTRVRALNDAHRLRESLQSLRSDDDDESAALDAAVLVAGTLCDLLSGARAPSQHEPVTVIGLVRS